MVLEILDTKIKTISDIILESAFVDMFRLLAGNYDDVLDVVMTTVEEAANNSEDMRKKQQIDKDISAIESKKSRMTDMLIDGTISKETYNEKNIDFSRKLNTLSEKKMLLEESINKRRNIGKRMTALRNTLSNNIVLDEFDRVVFESIVEKVIVGGFDESGTPDPYKLTFMLKSQGEEIIPHVKECYKKKQKEIKTKKKGNNKVS